MYSTPAPGAASCAHCTTLDAQHWGWAGHQKDGQTIHKAYDKRTFNAEFHSCQHLWHSTACARCCSELASLSIATILFGCCRGSPSKLRSIPTIFRSSITVKKSSFSFGVRPWTLCTSHTPKSGGTATAGSGAQVFISLRSPRLFTDTRKWTGQEQMSKCCTLGVLSLQPCSAWVWHHSLPRQERPWGKDRANSSHMPRTWFTPALHQLSVPLHFSQNLCESDLGFLSGMQLAGYVSNKMKHGVYSGALPSWMKTQRCLQMGLKGTDLFLMQSHHSAEGNGAWVCLKDSRDHLIQSPAFLCSGPSPLCFSLPCQKLQVLSCQHKPRVTTSCMDSTTATKVPGFPFFPSGNFSAHIGLSPRPSPVLQGWLFFEPCQKHKKCLKPSWGNNERPNRFQWTWWIPITRLAVWTQKPPNDKTYRNLKNKEKEQGTKQREGNIYIRTAIHTLKCTTCTRMSPRSMGLLSFPSQT